jgi:hypothetical protein
MSLLPYIHRTRVKLGYLALVRWLRRKEWIDWESYSRDIEARAELEFMTDVAKESIKNVWSISLGENPETK